MSLRGLISDTEAWIVALLLGAAMAAAWRVGWRRGRDGRAAGLPAPESRVEDAALALLGLLLAFTFSIALSKYDRRREALIIDANAIGDFYTCATLVSEPARTKLRDAVREYTRLRLELAMRGYGADMKNTLPRFVEMHGRMTDLVGEALAAGTPIAVPLTQTLNALTSSYAARLEAIRDRLPDSIVALLLIAATLSAGLVGRQQGISARPSIAGTVSFIAIVVLTVSVTLDLNQPARGLIQVSQEPMQRLLSSMGK
jgi:hypothetical protein